jgi:hypothetical protein
MDEDHYSTLLTQTADDMVRALLTYPDGSHEGADALRRCSTLLVEEYGAVGILDLAEQLAADLAELMEVLAKVEGRNPLEVLDSWNHDEPMPEI